MKEVWKNIEYAPNYEVSNFGNVRNKKTKRILKPKLIRGYESVCLRNNNKNFTKQVHRLVAIAFIPNPENKPCVNHKDFNRSNNIISNLEWFTHKENQLWSRERISRGHCKGYNHNICKNKNGYFYQKRFGEGKRIRKWFKTLEEALKFRETIERGYKYE